MINIFSCFVKCFYIFLYLYCKVSSKETTMLSTVTRLLMVGCAIFILTLLKRMQKKGTKGVKEGRDADGSSLVEVRKVRPLQEETVHDPTDDPLDGHGEPMDEHEARLSETEDSLLDEFLDRGISPGRKEELAEQLRELGYKVEGSVRNGGESISVSPTDRFGDIYAGGTDEEYQRPETDN